MRFEAYETCMKCPDLCRMRANVVWGFGNEVCDIMLVGEAPGGAEDIQGVPFVGEAGHALDELLKEAEIARSEIYITNTVMCRPTRPGTGDSLVNRPPSSAEVANCLPRLQEEIVRINPIIIVALGDVAASALWGKKLGIKKSRGNAVDIKIRTSNDIIVAFAMLPVFHPAYLLRTKSAEEIFQTVNDLRTAKAIVDQYRKTMSPCT